MAVDHVRRPLVAHPLWCVGRQDRDGLRVVRPSLNVPSRPPDELARHVASCRPQEALDQRRLSDAPLSREDESWDPRARLLARDRQHRPEPCHRGGALCRLEPQPAVNHVGLRLEQIACHHRSPHRREPDVGAMIARRRQARFSRRRRRQRCASSLLTPCLTPCLVSRRAPTSCVAVSGSRNDGACHTGRLGKGRPRLTAPPAASCKGSPASLV